jgi:RNA polymerase sigma factor (sigma-70 family)
MGETTQLEDWLDKLQNPREGEAGRRAREQAFGELVGRFQTRLAALARRALQGFPQVQSHAETDDVLIEAQLRIYRQLQRFDPALAPEGWTGPDGRMHTLHFLRLAGFEIRRALLDLKKTHRRAPGVIPGPENGPGDRQGDVFAALPDPRPQAADRVAELDELCVLYETLPEPLRDVFVQVGLCGLTHKEAAKVLEIPDSTVRSRWTQAQLKLRKEWLDRQQRDGE